MARYFNKYLAERYQSFDFLFLSFDFTFVPIANTKDNLPLAEFLSARRKFLKIRLADLEQKTGISSRYLKKIESGDWPSLPSGVYAKGFLKKYARVVGLDEGEVVFRYDQEVDRLAKQSRPIPGSVRSAPKSALKKLDILERFSLRKILIGSVAVFVIIYIGWQFKPILEQPSLNINNPREENVATNESSFKMEGQITPGSILTINNETVYPEENGSFKKDIELLPGLNVLEIKAVSRFGKETSLTRRITYNKPITNN